MEKPDVVSTEVMLIYKEQMQGSMQPSKPESISRSHFDLCLFLIRKFKESACYISNLFEESIRNTMAFLSIKDRKH